MHVSSFAGTVLNNDFLSFSYNYYNKKYFKGKLPDIPIKFKPMKRYMGCTRFRKACPCKKCRKFIAKHGGGWVPKSIFIDSGIAFGKADELAVYTTLIHEMIHVSVRRPTHGPKFRKEKKRLLRTGACNTLLD